MSRPLWPARRPAAIVFTFVLAVASGCRDSQREGAPAIRRTYIGPETSTAQTSSQEAARRDCEARMREELSRPSARGVPAIESSRAAFFAKVKAEPTLFVRAPEYSGDPVSLTVRGYREMLLSGQNPFGMVTRILEESEGFPKQAREAILRDGYLFADDPRLGGPLVALVQPHQLFGQPRIWIQRGEDVLHAERRGSRFYYVDGPLLGQRVRFVLFDRAGADDGPAIPVHRDLRALRYALHFQRMQLRHVTDDHIVANLLYGTSWVPTVLATRGAHVELECEIVGENIRAEVDAAREEARRREPAVQALRRVMLTEVDEALPFDEPVHEYGFQLDGTLRGKWRTAYLAGRYTYAFNRDEYQVFDVKGRPLVPQVCVDFLTDTLERASGTWWLERGGPRGRTSGKLDFDGIEGETRLEMRRAPGFIEYAKNQTDDFEVKDDFEPIDLGAEDALYSYLEQHASDFAPGDAVLIKGKTPWDPTRVHFHSFFVYENDPVTGMPVIILGNAGRPILRVWQTEVRRTPKRSIVARIRFRTAWLERIVSVKPLDAVPPLAAGPD